MFNRQLSSIGKFLKGTPVFNEDAPCDPIDLFLVGNLPFLELVEFDNVKIAKLIKQNDNELTKYAHIIIV